MLDGFKRKIAAVVIGSTLKSLATSKDTRTTITGLIAAAVLASGVDIGKVLEGDPIQIARAVSAVLLAVIGILATRENADGKTSLLGVISGALYAAAGSIEAITTGVVIALVGYFTNKGGDADDLNLPKK